MVAERRLGDAGDRHHRLRWEGMVIRVVIREGILIRIQVDLGSRRGHGFQMRKGDLSIRGRVERVHRRRHPYPCPGED